MLLRSWWSPNLRGPALVCAVGLWGCGGQAFEAAPEEEEDTGEIPTELRDDSTTRLSELTPRHRAQLCVLLRAAFDSQVDNQAYLEVLCVATVWEETADNLARCDEAFASCVAFEPAPRLSDIVECDQVAPLDSDCVEVRDLLACYRDFGAAAQQEIPELTEGPRSCAEGMTNPPNTDSAVFEVTQPTSCEIVALRQESCAP